MKKIKWLGNSRRCVQNFSEEAKDKIGSQLWLVQNNRPPNDWKPMESIGHGVIELRVHVQGEFRVLYVAKFPGTIYVLSAFQKKTQKTPQIEILRARNAYAEIKNYQTE